MIKGFEDYTQPITEEERYLSTVVFHIIKIHGPISSNAIIKKIGCVYKEKVIRNVSQEVKVRIDGPTIRKMVHYLRCEKHKKIIATNKGYNFTYSKRKVREYRESLKQRISSIQEVVNAMDV